MPGFVYAASAGASALCGVVVVVVMRGEQEERRAESK
jgi:hypothetical protein